MILNTLKKILPGFEKGYPKDFITILENLYQNSEPNQDTVDLLWKAYQFGENAHKGQLRRSGKPYFIHCSAVGVKLAEWRMDVNTIIAGLLHDTVEDTDVSHEILANEFNPEIAELVDGVSKLSGIKFNTRQEKQAENFMKMFLSVAKDIRVIIIKFADRLHNMKTLGHLPLIKQRRIAIETRDVFTPLAHRLGMNQLKVELEDLVLKTLEPESYKNLQKKIRSSKKEREKYIKHFSEPIETELEKFDIKARVFGRAKHYYSIFGKMQKRNKKYEELFDLFAIRVIVEKVEQCYAVLGIAHQIYTPLQERFKDYIATPKSNGYQSIHTTVFGKNGKMVEIQIRTEEMDKTAEIGVAAHWVYKESGSIKSKDTQIDMHMKWLRELVDALQSEGQNPNEFLNILKVDLFQDEIFIFTPKGDVISLNAESTPVDFAFSVHTQVGMHCIGAKVNGKIVPLNTKLNNGDSVEVITSDSQTPSYAWLKFVKTAKAKSHIKRWVKREQHKQSIQLGKEIVEKTLRRLKRLSLHAKIKESPGALGFSTEDMIYSAIANGQLTVRNIIEKYDESHEETQVNDPEGESLTKRFINRARGVAKGVKVDGISNTLISFAKCCSPIPGDDIVGYITRGRGVTVHRSTCSNIPVLENEDRFINVNWDVKADKSFIVRLKIMAEDRKNFLKDMTEAISSLNINITSVDIRANEGIVSCIMILEIRDTKQLNRLQRILRQIKDIVHVERM
jgi:GTP pyrophosphokinase